VQFHAIISKMLQFHLSKISSRLRREYKTLDEKRNR